MSLVVSTIALFKRACNIVGILVGVFFEHRNRETSHELCLNKILKRRDYKSLIELLGNYNYYKLSTGQKTRGR